MLAIGGALLQVFYVDRQPLWLVIVLAVPLWTFIFGSQLYERRRRLSVMSWRCRVGLHRWTRVKVADPLVGPDAPTLWEVRCRDCGREQIPGWRGRDEEAVRWR